MVRSWTFAIPVILRLVFHSSSLHYRRATPRCLKHFCSLILPILRANSDTNHWDYVLASLRLKTVTLEMTDLLSKIIFGISCNQSLTQNSKITQSGNKVYQEKLPITCSTSRLFRGSVCQGRNDTSAKFLWSDIKCSSFGEIWVKLSEILIFARNQTRSQFHLQNSFYIFRIS